MIELLAKVLVHLGILIRHGQDDSLVRMLLIVLMQVLRDSFYDTVPRFREDNSR